MKRLLLVAICLLPVPAFGQVFVGAGGGYFYNAGSAIRSRFENGGAMASFEFGYRVRRMTFFWRTNRPAEMRGYKPRYYEVGGEIRLLPRTSLGAGMGYLVFTETTGLRQRSLGLMGSVSFEVPVSRLRLGMRLIYDAHGVDRDDMPGPMVNVGGLSAAGYLRVMLF